MASLLLRAPPIAPLSLTVCSSRISSSHSETLGTSLACSPSPFSLSATSVPTLPFVYCGRGDKKTAKGKRFNHSFGNARPRNKRKGRGPPRVSVPSSPPQKDLFQEDEKVKIEIDESLL